VFALTPSGAPYCKSMEWLEDASIYHAHCTLHRSYIVADSCRRAEAGDDASTVM
jgi:hypothetical protein